jgi:hypothetical protein
MSVPLLQSVLFMHFQKSVSSMSSSLEVKQKFVNDIRRHEVLTAVNVTMLLFWVLMPRGLIDRYRCLAETQCLHLKPLRWPVLHTRKHIQWGKRVAMRLQSNNEVCNAAPHNREMPPHPSTSLHLVSYVFQLFLSLKRAIKIMSFPVMWWSQDSLWMSLRPAKKFVPKQYNHWFSTGFCLFL